MKSALLALFLILPLAGCTATSTTPPAALAPGALNQFDQTTYKALAAAHAFALSASTNAATLTSAEKSALNTFILALNSADVLYAAYHSGAATQAQMQTSLNSVTAAQTAYTNSVTSGVK